MVLPLLLAGVTGVAAGALGSIALGSKKENTVAMQQPSNRTYAPVSSRTYAPSYSSSYQSTTNRTYQPQLSYAPQYIINSPQASQESKKELSTSAYASQQPSLNAPFTSGYQFPTSPSVSTSQPTSASPTTVGGDLGGTLLIAGAAVAALYLLKR